MPLLTNEGYRRCMTDIWIWLVTGVAMIVVAELLLLDRQRRLLLLDPRRCRFFVELRSIRSRGQKASVPGLQVR